MKWNVKFLLKNFRKKTKSKSEKRIAIIVWKRNEKTKERYDIQKNRRNRQSIKNSRRNRKENSIIWFWNREFHEIKRRISFFFLTKKRKSTNIDTNIKTLKRWTMIVTILAKSYFSTNDIAEFIDELNKRKRRILTQISEIFTKLSKRWKILFFEKNFHSHDRKDSDSNDKNDLDFFFHKFNEDFWKKRKKSKKNIDFHRDFRTSNKTFSFFFTHDEKKKKK